MVGRGLSLIARQARRRAARRAQVVFVSGPGGDARRYRCDHQAEQLRLAGVPAAVVYRDELAVEQLAGQARSVVLYRAAWDDGVARLLDAARATGTTVLADVDDLVFDPARAHLIRALEQLAEPDRHAYGELIEGLRRTLAEVDGVVVSTEPLGNEAARLNGRVAVAFNAVNLEMASLGERARLSRVGSSGVTVAYLSGTPTHDRDFLEAADAVLWTLERYPAARFLAVGYLSLDARFEVFGDRVKRIGPVAWKRLPEVLAGADVNLAPLERGNAFTEAKSCLKYLEAALVGVPTIASPRADFVRAIAHGENGLLADDPEAWQGALAMLAESPGLRARLGDAAYRNVRESHTTAARAEATAAVFLSLAPSTEMPSSES